MIKTYNAEKDFNPYLFIKFGTNEKLVTTSAGPNDNLIGVGTNVPALEGRETDVILQGEAELRLGGTVKAGDRLTSDANAKGIKAKTNVTLIPAEGDGDVTAENMDIVKAIALQDGVNDDIIRVCVV